MLDISLEQLGEIEITTAAKVPEPIAKTAATVSVITGEELRRAGARTFYDALERLPGVSVGVGQFGDHFIAVRGIRSTWSEKVLLLLDGHLLNDARSGSATFQFLDSLPVDNIARIEVVRGPGSALYGANAFLGVINIITRQPDEIGGVEAAASGEFESEGRVASRYNVLGGGVLGGEWRGWININRLDAPGPELTVDADAFGAEGVADMHVDRLGVQGALSNGTLTLRGRYLRRDAGDGFGGGAALNDQSRQQVEYGFVDAEYRAEPARATDLILRAYLDQQDTDNHYEVPPSSIIADLLAQETITGAEARLDHRGIASHTLTAGLAWRRERLHHVVLRANFDPTATEWIDPAERDVASLYAQDLWDVRDDLRATLGARYDRYSDFGSTFNPRVGLVWQATPALAARISYGSAFRAPSFIEQHVKNNPAQLGNPDLEPEKIGTWEAGFQWRQEQAQAAVTLFRSRLSNLIDIPSGETQYQNLGEATVRGVELEGRYRFGGTDLAANYGYADPDYTDLEPPMRVPRYHVNLTADVPLAANTHWNLHALRQWSTPRAGTDSRAAVAGAWRVNAALTLKRGAWDYTASVFNLTDTDTAAAAPAGTIPGDFTAQGRSFLLGARFAY